MFLAGGRGARIASPHRVLLLRESWLPQFPCLSVETYVSKDTSSLTSQASRFCFGGGVDLKNCERMGGWVRGEVGEKKDSHKLRGDHVTPQPQGEGMERGASQSF